MNYKIKLEKSLILLSKIKEQLEEECCESSLDATNLAYDIKKLFDEFKIENTWENPYYKTKII